MMRSNPGLKRLYRRYNERYFDGKLPDDTVIFFAPHPQRDGCCYFENGRFIIEIDPGCMISARFVHIIVLHEMRHIKLHPSGNHDRKFKADGRRLVAMGALDRWL